MIDLSSAMLAHAPAGAGRVRGDVAALPFAAGSFDVVTAGWVIETVPDPLATMRELLRVLQPDGFLLAAFSATPRHLARLWRPLDRVLRTEFSGHFLSPAGRRNRFSSTALTATRKLDLFARPVQPSDVEGWPS